MKTKNFRKWTFKRLCKIKGLKRNIKDLTQFKNSNARALAFNKNTSLDIEDK